VFGKGYKCNISQHQGEAMTRITDREIQTLRNTGNVSEEAAKEIIELRERIADLESQLASGQEPQIGVNQAQPVPATKADMKIYSSIAGRYFADAMTTSLAGALPLEIERVQELISICMSIPMGHLAASMMRASIMQAHQSMMDDDVVAMLQAYEDLKGFTA
jgi:hypothetical protein